MKINDTIQTSEGPAKIIAVFSDGVRADNEAWDEEKFFYFSELPEHELYIDPAGNPTIITSYHDGEYLSGYQVFEGAKLLEKIGLAKYVDGWGYLVTDEIVNDLGIRISYQSAIEYSQPRRMEKWTCAEARRQERAEKFVQAARTNQPVILDQYSDDCNDPREECDTDNVTVYAMPNGSTKTERNHTW